MKKLLSVFLAIVLMIPIVTLGSSSVSVSAASGYKKKITISKTGVYVLNPVGDTSNGYSISVYDKHGKEVKLYEKLGGYPLVANQEYTLNLDKNYTTVNTNKKYDTIFPDTSSGDWYNDAVTYAVGSGIISGYGNGKFGPGDNIQRQDFMVILAKLEGVDFTYYGNKSTYFGDVPEGSYYEAAVNWGYENGIVSGYVNGYFGTGDPITREQLVTFLYGYAKYKKLDVSYKPITKTNAKNTYSDYKYISSWAEDKVLWALENKVISGKTKSTISPGGNALRCEVAQIMFNLFNNNTFASEVDDNLSLSGTTILFASTIDPKSDGTDYVIDKFEKEYGINVEIVMCTLDTYNAQMCSLIAAGKAPTVGRSNGDAPIYVGYFDSLDKADINYNDEIWDQRMFKLSTYNYSPRLCNTVGNFWTEMDIVVYSKSLLKKANVPTPEELDKTGKWTWDAYLEIGKKTAELEGCDGATYGSIDTLVHMLGGAVYRSDSNNRMISGFNNKTADAFQKISQAYYDRSIFLGGPNYIMSGQAAISTTSLWSLRTDGNLRTHPRYADLGFYYLPAPEEGEERYVTGVLRGWGIFKGCNENPATGSKAAKAGGLFLREYLDVNNYALNSSFLTEEAKTFFFRACDEYYNTDNYNPYYTAYNLNSGISGVNVGSDVYSCIYCEPSQVSTKYAATKATVEQGCNNLNKYIEQNIY